ncbi:unnamed protein product, partial [Musa acuminata subsp. burmannicoides]
EYSTHHLKNFSLTTHILQMIAMQTKCGNYVKQMLPLHSTYQIPEPGSIALQTEKVHVTGYRSYMEVKYQVFFTVTPKM